MQALAAGTSSVLRNQRPRRLHAFGREQHQHHHARDRADAAHWLSTWDVRVQDGVAGTNPYSYTEPGSFNSSAGVAHNVAFPPASPPLGGARVRTFRRARHHLPGHADHPSESLRPPTFPASSSIGAARPKERSSRAVAAGQHIALLADLTRRHRRVRSARDRARVRPLHRIQFLARRQHRRRPRYSATSSIRASLSAKASAMHSRPSCSTTRSRATASSMGQRQPVSGSSTSSPIRRPIGRPPATTTAAGAVSRPSGRFSGTSTTTSQTRTTRGARFHADLERADRRLSERRRRSPRIFSFVTALKARTPVECAPPSTRWWPRRTSTLRASTRSARTNRIRQRKVANNGALPVYTARHRRRRGGRGAQRERRGPPQQTRQSPLPALQCPVDAQCDTSRASLVQSEPSADTDFRVFRGSTGTFLNAATGPPLRMRTMTFASAQRRGYHCVSMSTTVPMAAARRRHARRLRPDRDDQLRRACGLTITDSAAARRRRYLADRAAHGCAKPAPDSERAPSETPPQVAPGRRPAPAETLPAPDVAPVSPAQPAPDAPPPTEPSAAPNRRPPPNPASIP